MLDTKRAAAAAAIFMLIALPPAGSCAPKDSARQNEPEPRAALDPGAITDSARPFLDVLLPHGETLAGQFSGILREFEQAAGSRPDIQRIINDESHPAYKSYNAALAATYYDLGGSFYKIGIASKDKAHWFPRAREAIVFYRDRYVVPFNGKIPAYRTFTDGLYLDYQMAKDKASKDAVLLLSKNAPYASDDTLASESAKLKSPELSRETAYGIMTMLHAEMLGAARRQRLSYLVDCAIGHAAQWTAFLNNPQEGRRSWVPNESKEPYVRAFMAGLTVEALLRYHERNTADGRILPAVTALLDAVKNHMWAGNAFKYTDHALPPDNPIEKMDSEHLGTQPQPDLNLLIAPAFLKEGIETNRPDHVAFARQALSGALGSAYLSGFKQFNQAVFLALPAFSERGSY